MTRKIFFLILIALSSCKTINQPTTYEKIKSGLDLESIKLVSFDRFLNYWSHNKRIQKVDLNIREIYQDNHYTYFGKPKLGLTTVKWTFFKVETDSIVECFPNFKEFYGTDFNNYLWSHVFPKEDIELWDLNRTTQNNHLRPNCPYKNNKPIFRFSLIDKRVRLIMSWEIKCDELESIRNKTYIGYYDLLTKQLTTE